MVVTADAMADTVSVMGKVTDANGNPIHGAYVTMVDTNYQQVVRTISDANGDFEFVSVNLGTDTFKMLTSYTDGNKTYTVPPEHAAWHSSDLSTAFINQTETQLSDYVLPPFSAMGTVTDANGAPLEGARVMLIDSNFKETQATRSDTNGNYEFVSVPKTAENFTISVLFIKNNQSYKASSTYQYPESGVQTIGTMSVSGYTPFAVSQQATVQTTEPSPTITAAAEAPLNGTAFALALLIGLLALTGVYLILKREG
jgi:uncharacterized protein YfaS (alpha-2-macroglobulin family)